MHGNLAQKTAVLWPAFNTHGKTMASLQMVQAGSAVSVAAGVLFFLFFSVHIGPELENSSPVSLMSVLSFGTIQGSEK